MPNKLQKITDINTYWITNCWEHMENYHGSVVHIKILDWHLLTDYTDNDESQKPKKK